jgi:hypothetical protein
VAIVGLPDLNIRLDLSLQGLMVHIYKNKGRAEEEKNDIKVKQILSSIPIN